MGPPGNPTCMTGVHVVVCVPTSTTQGDCLSNVAVAWTVVIPPTVPPDMLLMRHPLSAMVEADTMATMSNAVERGP